MIPQTKVLPLDSHVEVLSALRLGWTVRAKLLKIALPVGGIELTVYDARIDGDAFDENWHNFQVLTLQGWHSPTRRWAIEGERIAVEAKVERQESLFK